MAQELNFKQELVGCFGFPVSENPTQAMIEPAFDAMGLAWRYLTLEVRPENLAEAVSDCAHVYATTVRKRGVTKPVVTPEEAAGQIAVQEGRRLHIPIVSIVDTNCDPELVDYIIPGNDDAIRSIRLLTSRVADACIEGKARYVERRQAEADKGDIEETDETEVMAEDLKPGDRKVISDGTDGPVVEIIKRSSEPTDEPSGAAKPAAEAPAAESAADDAEKTGE